MENAPWFEIRIPTKRTDSKLFGTPSISFGLETKRKETVVKTNEDSNADQITNTK